jgi:hypothetical protein
MIKSFLSKLVGGASAPQSAKSLKKVAIVTNFSACKLGFNLVKHLVNSDTYHQVIGISHNASRFSPDMMSISEK